MHRFNIYEDDHILIQGEMEGDAIFIHCDVFDWSVHYCKRIYDIWDQVLEEFKSKGVKSLYAANSESTRKFAQMFGFVPKYLIEDNDGNRVYISELEVF